jgi:hypothetical protein
MKPQSKIRLLMLVFAVLGFVIAFFGVRYLYK